MDADRDAICNLMYRGLDDFSTVYDEDGEYERAEALWGKWCDPERVECPRCEGDGTNWDELEDCPDCYGTGKVRPPAPPPPPPPPKSEYSIVNGGIDSTGHFRAIVLKNGNLHYMERSYHSYDAAREYAEAFIAAAEKDE